MSYFQCFSVTVSAIYCFNPKTGYALCEIGYCCTLMKTRTAAHSWFDPHTIHSLFFVFPSDVWCKINKLLKYYEYQLTKRCLEGIKAFPKSLQRRNSRPGQAKRTAESFQIETGELFMYSIQCIRFGSWKVRRLNRALVSRKDLYYVVLLFMYFFMPERKRFVELCKRDGIKLVQD